MVQFNLLPDVKIEFIKAQRQKHVLTVASIAVAAVCVGLLVVSLLIMFGQKQYIRVVNDDIKKSNQKLQEVPNINKMLTVQNQLNQLTLLHEHKPAATRVFDYLTQVTPKQASLSKLSLDYASSTLVIGGHAPSLDVVRIFTETLKLTSYESEDGVDKGNAFSEVVLTSFATGNDGADFTITMKFKPVIFDIKQEKLQFSVPPTAGADKENIFKEEK